MSEIKKMIQINCCISTRSERTRFLRIGGFGRTFGSSNEPLLNSDVNDATLIFITIINQYVPFAHYFFYIFKQIQFRKSNY